MNQEPIFFELTDSGNFLRIAVLKHSYSNTRDNWDKSWVDCRIETKSGAFSGTFDAQLRTTDFKTFEQQLQPVYDTLKGTANFYCLDNYVNIVVTGDGIGHLNAKCTVADSTFPLNELTFQLEFDQTYLPNIINQLNHITRTYPIV